MKTSLFGIIALLVLTVSVPSAFAQSSELDSPIRMVLDMTRDNILESLDDTGGVPSSAQTFYDLGQNEYEKAIDALNSGDLEAAEEHALIAMALYEDSASVIGELEESLVLDRLPPGFGSSVGSSGESEGQGLGVGGIPPGQLNQLVSANIFEISEEITDIEEEVGGLRELIDSNNIDVNLQEYDDAVNLAKEVLANGDIPNAQAKLELANEVKDNIYEQIDAAVEENQDERIREFVDERINDIENILEKGENLGLTQKTIDELQDTLEVLENGEFDEIIEKTGEDSEFVKEIENNDEIAKEIEDDDSAPGNSENAPGQNNDDSAPGNSENAPGQNNDDSELLPGFGASVNNPSESGFENGDGLGLGKLPPGLAKKMFDSNGVDEGIGESFEDSTSESGFEDNGVGGFENLPPGLAKKFDATFEQSADDSYEYEYEDTVDDDFEDKYDKTQKGNGKAKGKLKNDPGNSENNGNSENAPGQNNDDSGGGPSKGTVCHNPGVSGEQTKFNAPLNAHLGHGDTLGECSSGSGGSGSGGISGCPYGEAPNSGGQCKSLSGRVSFSDGNAVLGGTIGSQYTVNNFSATGTGPLGGDNFTSYITIQVLPPSAINNTAIIVNATQPYSFTPDVEGDWRIVADVQGVTDGTNSNRTATIAASGGGSNAPTVTNNIPDININENALTNTLDLGLVFNDDVTPDASMTYTVSSNNTALVPESSAISGKDLTLNYADSGTGVVSVTITAEDADAQTVDEVFLITITAGCSSSPGTPASGSGTIVGGACTVIGDNYDVGNNYNTGDGVRIGDNFISLPNGQGGTNLEFENGAIVGDNVNLDGADPAAGVIIPNNTDLS